MNTTKKAYLYLHISVLLFGFTAILGKLIKLPEISLVWWRLLLTCGSLLLLPGLIRSVRNIPLQKLLKLGGIGIIVALHWVTFYGAIKYSNVSVTLSCFATLSFFTSILEPLLTRSRFRWYEMGLGLLVIPGIAIIVHFTSGDYWMGIFMGLISSLLAAFFTIFNKRMVEDTAPLPMTMVELGSGLIFLSFLMPFYMREMGNSNFWPDLHDTFYLLILAIFCTTLAYVISLKALKHISAFTANLTINLEPIYGILMAWLIFEEHKEMASGFYFGAAIVLLTIFIHPLLKRWFD